MQRYMIAQMDEIDPLKCPCGLSRRAFVEDDNPVATLHMVDVAEDSHVHYHKKLSEIYLIIEGEGHMELDDEIVPVKRLTSVFIKPGCRHRAVGRMRLINIPIPAFDPDDEWFD